MSIGSKWSQVMTACQFVAKDKTNAYHKYSYTSAAELFAKVNAELTNNGLHIKRTACELVASDVNSNGKYAVVKVTIEVGDTSSDETITIEGMGSGVDNGDKAVMKANTAAFKYAWLGGLCCAMTDDPEADSAIDSPTAPALSAQAKTKAQDNFNDVVGQCEICGTGVTRKNIIYAKKFHGGRMLCYKCQQEIKNAEGSAPF